MDIKSVNKDYSLIKAILAVRPKNGGEGGGGVRAICDIKITLTLCVYSNIEHPTGISLKNQSSHIFRRCSIFLHLYKKNCFLIMMCSQCWWFI